MDLLRLARCGRLARADGPDGLIGDDDGLEIPGADALQPALDLPGNDVHRLAALPFSQGLADAEDRENPGFQGCLDFFVDAGVCLPEILPPLRMPDDHVLTTGILEQGSRDLAREGAFLFPEEVLGGQLYRTVLQDFLHFAQRRERRGQDDFRFGKPGRGLDDRRGQIFGLGDSHVHLPVSGDKWRILDHDVFSLRTISGLRSQAEFRRPGIREKRRLRWRYA